MQHLKYKYCAFFYVFSMSIAQMPDLSDIVLDCKGSDKVKKIDFCDEIVTWWAAQAYNATGFSPYYTTTALTLTQQDEYAKQLYKNMLPSKANRECKQSMKRLACGLVFPECPSVETVFSSIAYFPTCSIQCSQAANFCGLSVSEQECDLYASSNCMLVLPSGFFVLSPEQGPYDTLPTLYGVVLACWICMALYWQVAAFYLYKESSVVICKAVATIPVIKVIVLILGVSFWATCQSWLMCSFWLGVSFINTHLVYETSMLTLYLLVAKGWSITRDTFTANEWRAIIIFMSGFYMMNSILLVLETAVLSRWQFWIANAILYGGMYIYIVHSLLTELGGLYNVVKLLGRDVPSTISSPIRTKFVSYIVFLIVVFANMSMEVVMHSLMSHQEGMYKLIMLYEITNCTCLLIIGFLFRPRIHSPFYFMVPTRSLDNRTRAIPVVEGVDQEASSGITVSEVELAPLLAMDPNTSSLPRYLMLMKNPDQAVNIGISVESLGSQNTRTLQEAEARIARRSSAANPRPRPPPGPGQTGNAIEMTATTASLVSGQQRDMGENPVHNPNQYHNPPPARPVHRGGGMSEDRSFQQVGIHAHEQDSLL